MSNKKNQPIYDSFGNLSQFFYFTPKLYNYKNKEICNSIYILQTLNKTNEMFVYENLPDSVPSEYLELFLQSRGHCIFTTYENDFIILRGELAGICDRYFLPKEYIAVNPYINQKKQTYIIENDVDAILCKNDTAMLSLIPIINRFTSLLVENDLTLQMNSIFLRAMSLINSTDDIAAKSAKNFIASLVDGNFEVIDGGSIINDGGIKTQPLVNQSNQTITQLIELEQYTKAALSNEIGLNANYNMKRESLNSNESQLNSDYLIPQIQNMLKCRKIFCDKINKKYNLNISVKLSNIWQRNFEKIVNISED